MSNTCRLDGSLVPDPDVIHYARPSTRCVAAVFAGHSRPLRLELPADTRDRDAEQQADTIRPPALSLDSQGNYSLR